MIRNSRSGHSTKKWLGFLIVTSLAAASCGGNKGASDDTTATTAGPATSAGLSTIASTTLAPADNKPKRGGKLTYALEAETATGFSSIHSQFAISGETVARTLYDPVMFIGEDQKAHGILAESMTPNADFTSWTIKLRKGIKFHDGTEFNGDALRLYMEAGRCSALVSTAWGEFGGCPRTFKADQPEDPKTNRKPVSTIYKSITVDPADPMVVKADLFSPYAILDYAAAGWWVEAPKMAQDPTNGPKSPIGTGPFKFKDWVVNDHITVVKNPDYWQKAPDGQAYPYLDEITFKPVDDVAARENGFRGGTFDIMMTSNGDTISKFRAEKDNFSIFENTVGSESAHYMINNFPTFKGKENAVADIRVRTGLAKCINYEEYNKLRNASVTPVSNGPYPPGVDGYLADTGYPKFDEAGGKALLDAYKKEKAISGDLELAFGTTADPYNKGNNELIATYWKKCGVNAVIDQTEQGQYITRALVGDFQIFGWRNFGGLNPDRNYVWWLTPFATDPPGIALNFGRIKDKEIDAALTAIRTSGDPAGRKAATETVNKAFGKNVYNIWINWVIWQILGNKKVQNMGGSYTAPDGAKLVSTARVSQNWMHQVWIK